MAGAVRGGDQIRSRMNATICCGRNSNKVSGGCTMDRGVYRNRNRWPQLSKLAGNGRTPRRTARAPAIKSGSLGALWRGLFGGMIEEVEGFN